MEGLINQTITETENERLIQISNDKEILTALHSIPSLKVSGPDGVLSLFYEHYGETVKPLLLSAIKSFFSSGFFLKEWNNTFICLTQKPNELPPSKTLDSSVYAMYATRLIQPYLPIADLERTPMVQGHHPGMQDRKPSPNLNIAPNPKLKENQVTSTKPSKKSKPASWSTTKGDATWRSKKGAQPHLHYNSNLHKNPQDPIGASSTQMLLGTVVDHVYQYVLQPTCAHPNFVSLGHACARLCNAAWACPPSRGRATDARQSGRIGLTRSKEKPPGRALGRTRRVGPNGLGLGLRRKRNGPRPVSWRSGSKEDGSDRVAGGGSRPWTPR
ncbi:hypothetical protein CRG98_031243 [Punica granatum]|uniref:Reverse transcriptase domain-containing protein n=1 Tax=Punica granatum TaxID=22663 RepID=A0A2I0IXJ9_PUNGR|nr:hypothetical protein CRG98_031243 [Punica granatum]